jgi:hypothetical protein
MRCDHVLSLTFLSVIVSGVPLERGISTQERNYAPTEELLWSTHRTDKYHLRQCVVDDLDLELGCILYVTRRENCA